MDEKIIINNFESVDTESKLENKDKDYSNHFNSIDSKKVTIPVRGSIFSDSLDLFKYRYKSEQDIVEKDYKNNLTKTLQTPASGTFYLTGLERKGSLSLLKKPEEEKSEAKINSKSKKKKEKRSEKEKLFKSTSNQFIDFILNEHTNYADIEQIEKEYLDLIKQKHNHLDKTSKYIEELNEKFNSLENEISNEIVNVKKNNFADSIKEFDERISLENKKIAEATYNYNSNTKIMNRSKIENHLLKQKFIDTLKETKLINEQFHKFKMLKNSTFSLLNEEIKTFNELREFEKMTSHDHLINLEVKKEVYNQLDFNLYLARNLTVEGEKVLGTIKRNQEKIKLDIKKVILLNNHKQSFNLKCQIYIIKEIVYMEKISQKLNISNLLQVIEYHHKLEHYISSNKKKIIKENIEIIDLIKVLKSLKEEKEKKELMISRLNSELNLKSNEEIENDEEYIIVQNNIAEIKTKNMYVRDFMLKQESLINKVTGFLIESLYKTFEVQKTIGFNSSSASAKDHHSNIKYGPSFGLGLNKKHFHRSLSSSTVKVKSNRRSASRVGSNGNLNTVQSNTIESKNLNDDFEKIIIKLQALEKDILNINSTINLNLIIRIYKDTIDPNQRIDLGLKERFEGKIINMENNPDLLLKLRELAEHKKLEAEFKSMFMKRNENDILKKSKIYNIDKTRDEINQIYKKIDARQKTTNAGNLINLFINHLEEKRNAKSITKVRHSIMTNQSKFLKNVNRFSNSLVKFDKSFYNKSEYSVQDDLAKTYQQIYLTGKLQTLKDERKKREIKYNDLLKEREEKRIQDLLDKHIVIKDDPLEFKRRLIDPNDSFKEDENFSKTQFEKNTSKQDLLVERLMKGTNKNKDYFKRVSNLNSLERGYFKLLTQREAFNVNNFKLKFNEMKKHFKKKSVDMTTRKENNL